MTASRSKVCPLEAFLVFHNSIKNIDGKEVPMKIYRPSPQILIVTQSRLSKIGLLLLYFIFFGFWYYHTLGLGSIPEFAQSFNYILDRLFAEPPLWLFVLAPLFGLPTIYKTIKVVAVGEQLSFDGIINGILKNQKPLARFNEVEHLQIRTISGEGEEYRLTAVLKSGKKIEIHTSGDSSDINALADDVADIVKVKVIRKD
jgi:hypothetical protein